MFPQLTRREMNTCTAPDDRTVFVYTKNSEEPRPWFLHVDSSDPSVYPENGNVFVSRNVMDESIDLLTRFLRYRHDEFYAYRLLLSENQGIQFNTEKVRYPFYFYYMEPVETGTISLIPPWERVKRLTILEDQIVDISFVNISAKEIVDSPLLMLDERFKLLFDQEVHIGVYQGVCYVPASISMSEKLENDAELLHFLDRVIYSGWSELKDDEKRWEWP